MDWRPDDYYQSAHDRLGEAALLRREKRHVLAMYVAGVAAECMLRAYRRANLPFDEGHDLYELLKNYDYERLNDKAREKLHAPVQVVRTYWRNWMRYASADYVQRYFHKLELDRNLPRSVDAVEYRSTQVYSACDDIVTIGVERWMRH